MTVKKAYVSPYKSRDSERVCVFDGPIFTSMWLGSNRFSMLI